MRLLFSPALALMMVHPALAGDALGDLEEFQKQAARLELVNSIATVIASEEFCDLEYDQEAIDRWIDDNVEGGDLGFASSLAGSVVVSQSVLTTFTASHTTVHCAAVEKTARHFGFVTSQ